MSPRNMTLAAMMIACLQTAGWADGRMFLVPLGIDPALSQTGVDFQFILAEPRPNNEFVIGVYVEAFENERVKGAQVTLPCSVECSLGGSINFLPISGPNGGILGAISPGVDEDRADFIFAGFFGAIFPAIDSGHCDDPNPPTEYVHPRAAIAATWGGLGPPIPVLVGRKYIAQFTYRVSGDCYGTATFALANEPDCAMRNDNNFPIPFTTDGLEVWVNHGQCCADGRCLGVTIGENCSELGLTWTPGLGCEEDGPCACVTNAPCVDTDACRCNRCVDGACANTSTRYADVDCNGFLNADDLLCWVSGFARYENCPNGDIDGCTRDGTIDIDDAVELISAWYGANPCGCIP